MDSEAHSHQDNSLVQQGDPALVPSAAHHVAVQKPAAVKKPTRQWAAWTHQEEQSFFAALRQVGKNFEKITSRVQSKNKDQVRHYYYRLVRRMNKLLGPELYLDSKNSKDTNAAMLRWWSLLEKHSCKASKLHLKPRRFKMFMEALEHQLQKDRKKTVRKRPSLGENCPPDSPSPVSNQNRPSGHDNRTVKFVLVDSHNIQKLGPGKSPLKRSGNIGVNRNNKGDSSTMKPAKQRQKPAAYKKWEKAAIAGVSLVADAAEHLERTIDKELGQEKSSTEKNNGVPVGSFLPPVPTFPTSICAETNIHNSTKLKLQLFPIDNCTRRALELDKHNPHLELTLPTRKKISSVMEHLNRKWGSSSVASGELMLFPNNAQQDSLTDCLRWKQDSNVSAGDVYAMIGSPPVFRLRYGWFSTSELRSVLSQAFIASSRNQVERDMNLEKMKDSVIESAEAFPLPVDNQCVDIHNDCLTSVSKNYDLALTSSAEPNKKNNREGNPTESTLWHDKVVNDKGIVRHQEADGLRLHNGTALSTKEWVDSLTNVSVGDLLSRVPHDLDVNYIDQSLTGRSQCLQQIPFSCDSFDAAIAAHISKQKDKIGCELTIVSNVSSIWDAEETCDAFVFQKNSAFHQEATRSSGVTPHRGCKLLASTISVASDHMVEDIPVSETPISDPEGEPIQSYSHVLENSGKDFNALEDICWPESLGPLELELPPSKHHNADFILSDSLSGLNRLIASSLDAFQNCSFFCSNKKESMSSIEAREPVSFSDFKIGNGI